MTSNIVTHHTIMAMLGRMEQILTGIEHAINADDSPAAEIDDLQAEAESCGCSAINTVAREPTIDAISRAAVDKTPDVVTLADAEYLLNEAGFNSGWLIWKSITDIFDRAASIVHGVMMANQSGPKALMPAIDPGLMARVDVKWPLMVWTRHANTVFTIWSSPSATEPLLQYAIWPKVIDWLASECPEPSEPEVTIQDVAASLLVGRERDGHWEDDAVADFLTDLSEMETDEQ